MYSGKLYMKNVKKKTPKGDRKHKKEQNRNCRADKYNNWIETSLEKRKFNIRHDQAKKQSLNSANWDDFIRGIKREMNDEKLKSPKRLIAHEEEYQDTYYRLLEGE